jgi:hypothetical protein
MRNGLRILGLFAFLAVLPSAHATDVTGTWKGAFDFQGTSVPLTFHLAVAQNVVTGTVEGMPTTPAEIHDGKVDGDSVSFWVNSDYEGQTYKYVFKGKVSEGQIDFSFGTDDGSWSATLTVKNSELPVAAVKPTAPDATGNWKGAFDFQGTSVPLTFHLTATAGALAGTVEGLPTTPAEIQDGKVDGDTVTFSVTTDYQGTPVKLVYKGKVSADGIKFDFGTEDGSWSAELTVTKSS